MKNDIIKGLISVANSLDAKGFGKEADQLDRIMRKFSQDENQMSDWKIKWEAAREGVNDFISEKIDSWVMNDSAKIIESWPEYKANIRGEGNSWSSSDTGNYPAWNKVRTELLASGHPSTASQRVEDYETIVKMVDEAHRVWESKPDADVLEEAAPVQTSQREEETSTQTPEPTKCKPNGKPLIRIPGDNTYGYQLTEDGTGFRAWTLKDCKPHADGRVFEDKEDKVKNAAGVGPEAASEATPEATPEAAPETTPEAEDLPEDELVNPEISDLAQLRAIKADLERENAQRIRQDSPLVQRAEGLLGINNRAIFNKMTPLQPGVGYKYLMRQIDKGIAKLEADSADDAPMSSEASKAERRISKFASLLSGEFGGLDKKIRR